MTKPIKDNIKERVFVCYVFHHLEGPVCNKKEWGWQDLTGKGMKMEIHDSLKSLSSYLWNPSYKPIFPLV